MKKIMILTAERTGTGHKSAANAIEKKLNNEDVKQIDSFYLMGKLGRLLENMYIPITTKCPTLYYIPYILTQAFPNLMHLLVYLKCRKKLKKEIDEFKPDLIITVHSMFTKAVSWTLIKNKLNIPFFIDVIDLVRPPKVWFDKNATAIFVPTKEVKEDYINKKMDEGKIFVIGFPIRDDIKQMENPKRVEDKINILLVNPSVNLEKSICFVKEVSKIENASINVVCGRDKRLYDTLIKLQNENKISKDVNIYSFISNINELLKMSHIVLTKAGPNMILETIRSGSAVVITGHVHGQENYNYEYVTKNGYGFKCYNPKEILEKLNLFLNSGELDRCLINVLNNNCTNGADFIASYIKNYTIQNDLNGGK